MENENNYYQVLENNIKIGVPLFNFYTQKVKGLIIILWHLMMLWNTINTKLINVMISIKHIMIQDDN
jgi:hypothetical protein